jgi:hypothetical protein
MFLVNGHKAKLIQFNRNGESLAYDDEDKQSIEIKIIPYNMDDSINFGTYSVPEATGYFMIRRNIDVKEGDQIEYNNRIYTILKVAEKWIYNRIEYQMVFVK